jgi:hypothetical protein
MVDRLRVRRVVIFSYDIIPYSGMSIEDITEYEKSVGQEGIADMLRNAPPNRVTHNVDVTEIEDL